MVLSDYWTQEDIQAAFRRGWGIWFNRVAGARIIATGTREEPISLAERQELDRAARAELQALADAGDPLARKAFKAIITHDILERNEE